MTGTDRRSALRLALAAALIPVLASRRASAQAFAGGLIDPPESAMVYRRIAQRDTADGRLVRVTRDFAVTFRRFDSGFMVHGEQLAVSFEAPPALARFGELARARDESGLFPIALDPLGRILSRDFGGPWEVQIDRAFDEALAALRSQETPQSERDILVQFVNAVHAAGEGITAHLPFDLFAPASTPRNEEQRIALPGGGEGRVYTRFSGEIDSNTGLMRVAMREVVTEAEGTRRTMSERWSLSAETTDP